jgi:hypothetical protein
MATVNKNFRIKHGLIVEGTSGTINGQNILTETGSDQYILDLIGGETLVKSVSNQFDVSVGGELSLDRTVVDTYYDAAGAAAAAQSAAATDATTKANAAQAAAEATASADATSKANAAKSGAEATAAADATSKANAAQAAAEATASADATSKANAAQAAAEATAASALSTAISTEVSNRNTAISTAVDSLVDGAPALLNTLNELAAAINDDANYTTTITTALGTKAPLASPALTGVPTAPTAAADTNTTQIATTAFAKSEADAAQAAAEATASADATSKANAAQSNAEDYADGLAVNYDAAGSAAAAQTAAEGTAQAALDDVLDATTAFTGINLNSVSKQQAAQSTIANAQNGSSMMSWAKSDYGTAKAWVKFATATHSQISEVLLTSDSTGNISITEFGMVGTNGSLGSVGASYLNGNIAIEVDTVHAATTVTVVATLIK